MTTPLPQANRLVAMACLIWLTACVDSTSPTHSCSAEKNDNCGVVQLDDDADGVNNGLDACPNTSPGATVNAQGCSGSQLVDSDADGVIDLADACPNTPSGYPINEDGCSYRVCHEAISAAASQCFTTVSTELSSCYEDGGEVCASDHQPINDALALMQTELAAHCPTDDLIRDAGYGPLITQAALQDQLNSTCLGEPKSLVARTYGGPHAYLLNNGTPADQVCLTTAYGQAATLLGSVYDNYAACVLDPDCDNSNLNSDTDALIASATTLVNAACPTMSQTMGSPVDVFLRRAADQAECFVAAAHGDTSTVDLNCGPNNVMFNNLTIKLDSVDGEVIESVDAIPPGDGLYIELDSDAWGTRCGRGGEYAFIMRLAERTDHLNRAVMYQAGGGVCFNSVNCGGGNNASMIATDETSSLLNGIRSNREENPFQHWSALQQPYCTQDLHIGGGGEETDRNGNTIYRYGAINLRASIKIYRDIIWRYLKQNTERGYLPEDAEIIFTGVSAGGYGVQYNMHYPLDEMRWQNTLSVPDAAFVIGGGTYDTSALFTAFGNAWNTRPFQPPYCLDDFCSTTVVNHPRHAERLGATPFQKLLNLSAQHDKAQENTQGYPGAGVPITAPGKEGKDWINRLRSEYCQIRGQDNLLFHLGANTQSRHGYIGHGSAYNHDSRATRELMVDGVSPLQMVANMVFHPGSEVDRVEEGPTLDGVEPFPCDVTHPANYDGDFDGDNVINQLDVCAAAGDASNGCPIGADDADDDGVSESFGGEAHQIDVCPNTPLGELANEFGCSSSQQDTDFDGVVDAIDDCAGTPEATAVDANGCPTG